MDIKDIAAGESDPLHPGLARSSLTALGGGWELSNSRAAGGSELSAEVLRAAMDTLIFLPSTFVTCSADLVVMRNAPSGWVCPE